MFSSISAFQRAALQDRNLPQMHTRARVQAGPPAGKGKLLEEVRRVLRARDYARRTEESYVGWMRRFILFHGKRHPLTMG